MTISVEPDIESDQLSDETTRGKLFKSIIVPEAIEPVEISAEPVALYDCVSVRVFEGGVGHTIGVDVVETIPKYPRVFVRNVQFLLLSTIQVAFGAFCDQIIPSVEESIVSEVPLAIEISSI